MSRYCNRCAGHWDDFGAFDWRIFTRGIRFCGAVLSVLCPTHCQLLVRTRICRRCGLVSGAPHLSMENFQVAICPVESQGQFGHTAEETGEKRAIPLCITHHRRAD